MTKTYEISLGKDILNDNIILITGPSRMGKTLLSRFLSTYENVEWIEEPYSLRFLIEMCANGQIDRKTFKKIFTANIHELFIDQILLRCANFRPNDLSNIWDQKSIQEILCRIESIKSREDVEMYKKRISPYFIIDIPDILPYVHLLRDFCKNLTVICVVRNPYDAAEDYVEKKWFDEAGKQNTYNDVYRNYEDKKVFGWLRQGDEEAFLKSSPYERGIIYWLSILDYDGIDDPYMGYDICIKYEDITENIDSVICKLSKYIDLLDHSTPMSKAAKSRIHKAEQKKEKRDLEFVDKKRLINALEKYGYEDR